MTSKELQKLLRNIKTERRGGAPHEGWVKQNRGILMMQVRNSTDSAAKRTLGGILRHFFAIFAPMETFAMAGRAVGIFLLVLGTVAGGGLVSAQVYRDATPGDAFYRMRMALESAQLVLAPNEEYKTKLHTEFADRRIDEAARLAEAGAERQAYVPQVLASFERDILALQAGLEKLQTQDPGGVAEIAKQMERKMATYQNILRKTGGSLSHDYAPSVARASDLVDGLTIKAMAVLVEKHLSGDQHAPKTVVASKMEDRLNLAETKLESTVAVTPKKTKAKAAIAEAKQLIKDENYRAALTKMEEVVELTKETEEEKTDETSGSSDETNGSSDVVPDKAEGLNPEPTPSEPATNTPTPP